MEYKKYAPLIGKKLTWEVIDMLARDMAAQVSAEVRKAQKTKYKNKTKKPVVHTEDDGS